MNTLWLVSQFMSRTMSRISTGLESDWYCSSHALRWLSERRRRRVGRAHHRCGGTSKRNVSAQRAAHIVRVSSTMPAAWSVTGFLSKLPARELNTPNPLTYPQPHHTATDCHRLPHSRADDAVLLLHIHGQRLAREQGKEALAQQLHTQAHTQAADMTHSSFSSAPT